MFEKGQRVRIVGSVPKRYKGKIGTIGFIFKGLNKPLYGIDLEDGDFYVAYANGLAHVDPPMKLVICTDNNGDIHAKCLMNGNMLAETVAKCHPDDDYNFLIGAQVALQKLVVHTGTDIVYPLLAGSHILPMHLIQNNKTNKN